MKRELIKLTREIEEKRPNCLTNKDEITSCPRENRLKRTFNEEHSRKTKNNQQNKNGIKIEVKWVGEEVAEMEEKEEIISVD